MKKFTPLILFILLISGVLVLIFYINKTSLQNRQLNQKSSVEISQKIANNYYDFTYSTFNESKAKGRTLLFFAATKWCTTCSALDKELIERNSEIPNNLTILKIDYDNDKKRNKEYFVTTQHTMILIDKNGKEIKRWVGGGIDTLIAEVGT